MTIKRCYPTLIGASVAENQLCNGESVTVPNGRKYYLKKSGVESLGASAGTAITGLTSGSDMVIDLTQMLGSVIADYVYSLETATAGSGIAWLRSYGFLGGYVPYNAGSIESVEVTEKKVVGFNQVDASTAKDNTYINSSGVESAQSEFMCTDYIPCLPSTIYYTNADVNAIVFTVIFYDADKNYIDKTSASNATFTTPSNACYMRANVIKAKMTVSELVINISNPDRNGEYEAYTSQSCNYGDDVLRGIFKLDANNNLYADGDKKEADGTITRRYGVVQITASMVSFPSNTYENIRYARIGKPSDSADKKHATTKCIHSTFVYNTATSNWDDAGKIRCVFGGASHDDYWFGFPTGTTLEQAQTALENTVLVYELATPTTETSTPFTSPQICYPDGTEEFVTENGVPVGHETKYQL